MLQTTSSQGNLNSGKVLLKAFTKMSENIGLSRKDLCDIIGFSEANASRLFNKTKSIDPKSKEGELVLLMLRLYRSLISILGDNDEQTKKWLNSNNYYFGARPIDHIGHLSGLIEVIYYWDAIFINGKPNPNMQTWQCIANKLGVEFIREDISGLKRKSFSSKSFEVEGKLPLPQ